MHGASRAIVVLMGDGVCRATLVVRIVTAVFLVVSALVWGTALAAAELSDEVNITKSDGDAGDEFGWAVAVSADGSTMVAGAKR